MHKQVRDFLSRIKSENPGLFQSGKILELGSLDINGSPREYFDLPEEYIGLDWRPGRGVDVVSLIHDYVKPDGYFDVIVSTETLEHDPYWKESLLHALRLLRPGGSLVLTMAGEGRNPHEIEVSPVKDHYQNLRLEMILGHVCTKARFAETLAIDNPDPGDLYFLFKNKLK